MLTQRRPSSSIVIRKGADPQLCCGTALCMVTKNSNSSWWYPTFLPSCRRSNPWYPAFLPSCHRSNPWFISPFPHWTYPYRPADSGNPQKPNRRDKVGKLKMKLAFLAVHFISRFLDMIISSLFWFCKREDREWRKNVHWGPLQRAEAPALSRKDPRTSLPEVVLE